MKAYDSASSSYENDSDSFAACENSVDSLASCKKTAFSGASSSVLFSILIPVYNEQAYLALVVERVLSAPLPAGVERELVVVDDCSTDRTSDVLATLVAKYPDKIRAFRQPKNQGKGAAIRRAIQELRGDFAIIQDADLEYDPNEYSLVLTPLLDGRADVVYGSRFATRETRKVLLYHHKLGNLFLTHFSNFLTGLDLTDMETCYKAFRADALKSIPLRSNRFGIEPEITAKIARRGWTVYEVPIGYNGRRYSEGKKIGWKDGVSAIRTIIKYWLLDDSFFDADRDPAATQTFQNCRNFAKLLVQKAGPFLGLRTLEIGAGQGNASRFLPQKERLTLVDSSEKNVRFLRASYDGNAVVDVARLDLENAETPSFENGANFDSIVCFNRLDDLAFANPDALRRLRSLLNPQGRLIFAAPAGKASKKSAPNSWTRKNKTARYSKAEIVRRLADAGFRVEKIEPFAALETFFRRRDAKKPSRFALKTFDATLRWTPRFIDALLPAARYFVVAVSNDQTATKR